MAETKHKSRSKKDILMGIFIKLSKMTFLPPEIATMIVPKDIYKKNEVHFIYS
jgi:hypothetical protein